MDNLMPKTIDHTDTARAAIISGIAAAFHGSIQTVAAATPAIIVNDPNFLSEGSFIIVAPMRNNDIGSNVKKATET